MCGDGHDSESKDAQENEMGFRITASSLFKQHVTNNSHNNDHNNDDQESEDRTDNPIYQSSGFKNKGHSKHTDLRSKTPGLPVIDDVSESKELSQRFFESFKKGSKVSLKNSFSKKQNRSPRIKIQDNNYISAGRNEHNTSGLIKSCSENISNIMEATFKDDDQKEGSKDAHRASVDEAAGYYFTANKLSRSGTPLVDEKPFLGKSKSRSYKNNLSLIKDAKSDKSTKRADHSVEELRKNATKPANLISEKTKNEILNRMKFKEKEKQKPNWVNEGESGNSLTYSKVFNASSRDY
jgi:hypothetical protein